MTKDVSAADAKKLILQKNQPAFITQADSSV